MWPPLSLCFGLTRDINYSLLEMSCYLWTWFHGWLVDAFLLAGLVIAQPSYCTFRAGAGDPLDIGKSRNRAQVQILSEGSRCLERSQVPGCCVLSALRPRRGREQQKGFGDGSQRNPQLCSFFF